MTKFERAARETGATLSAPWEDGSYIFDYGWCWVRMSAEAMSFRYDDIVIILKDELKRAELMGDKPTPVE